MLRLAEALVRLLPDELGAQDAARFLAENGTGMSPLAALAALVPASLYGEGLVRAVDRPQRARPGAGAPCAAGSASLVVVAFSPLLLLGGLSAAAGLTRALGDGTAAAAARACTARSSSAG